MKKSHVAIVFLGLVYVFSFFYYKTWEKAILLYGGDSFGYYAYLPALFIHHDIEHLRYSLQARNSEVGIATDTTKTIDVEEAYMFRGSPVIKYTCGIAILEAKAFFLAHLSADLLGYNKNGYSKPYLLCVLLWNLFFSWIGLLLLQKILTCFFKDVVVAAVLIFVGIGTNLFYFSTYNTGMSHGYLFTLYAALILSTIQYHRNYWTTSAIIVGLSAGLITLIRPNEIYCLLIPLLYGVTSFHSGLEKIRTVLSKKTLYVAVIVFAICIIPQLLYWHHQTGSFIFYSYGAESFDFRHPKIYVGLFGFKNGWFAYTPVMILAIIGIVFSKTGERKFLLPILLIIPMHVFIIYSWWCWFYMGGLGSRPMIEMYALLAIPLGSFIQSIIGMPFGKICIGILLLFFPAQQAMFNHQRWLNIMWSEDANATFYKQVFFKTKINKEDVIVYDTDEEQPKNLLFSHSITKKVFCDSHAADSIQCSFELNQTVRYTPTIGGTLKQCNAKPGDWLKISFYCINQLPGATLYEHATIAAEIQRGEKLIKGKYVRIQNKLVADKNYGIWKSDYPAEGDVSFFTQIPVDAMQSDTIKVYGFNNFDKPVKIKNMALEVWRH
jgi:hypothetical protein